MKANGKTCTVLKDITSHNIDTSLSLSALSTSLSSSALSTSFSSYESSSSTSFISNGKRIAKKTIDTSNKRQCMAPNMDSVDVPPRSDNSIDILKILKLAVCTFDQATIALGSNRAYKKLNHLCVNSEPNAKVPRESVYDSEMYRVLQNWLKIINNFRVTGQWHLEQVGEDGDHHHLYCDLVISQNDFPNPVAVLELLATASPPKLDKHFVQIFKYAQQFSLLEVWVVHFSHEDSIIENPYWPHKQLQERGLNVVHFWHDKEFNNVRISVKSRDNTSNFNIIINGQILP
ncbi:P-loop containing nucleoside triphosphate hydrolase protein [Gigaspora margarita]|uniref:P-loop containing nucleoside triphosphate hydrolase protein n=1 Tax=Gigaspora margarita TaxID=4874 RepID=A0A8H3WYH2_GIGMA|nr:P-loop containing nucleoside triphosphate hydrolase protein [Gigaspora margarita]